MSDVEQPEDDIDCLYCMDEGSIKRRYGTAGPGPAKIVKQRPCPMCTDSDRPETVVPHRTNPRELLSPVVEGVEFVERGEWKVTVRGAVFRDVMVGGLYMEGYRVGAIEHVAGEYFTFEVIENYDSEDEERFLNADTDQGDDR